jgi:hypothetical protein
VVYMHRTSAVRYSSARSGASEVFYSLQAQGLDFSAYTLGRFSCKAAVTLERFGPEGLVLSPRNGLKHA